MGANKSWGLWLHFPFSFRNFKFRAQFRGYSGTPANYSAARWGVMKAVEIDDSFKGQIISECLWFFLNFPKSQRKIKKNSAPESKKRSNHKIKALWYIKKVLLLSWFDHFLDSRAETCQIFRCFFGKSMTPKRHSEINWPLVASLVLSDDLRILSYWALNLNFFA